LERCEISGKTERQLAGPKQPLATGRFGEAHLGAQSTTAGQRARGTEFYLESLAQRFEVADIVARNAEFSNCWPTLFEDLAWSMFRTGSTLHALASLH
jgi:hypothetical protein